MVTQTSRGKNWEQSDCDRIRQAIDDVDVVRFSGASEGGSSELLSVEIEVLRSVDQHEITNIADDVRDALCAEGFGVQSIAVAVGYVGAMNPSLVLDVTFDSSVYVE